MRRIGWKRIKLLLIVMAMCGGTLFATEEFFQWFRLRTLQTSPLGAVEERLLWHFIPEDAMRFWPTFPFAFRTVEESLDRMYPVRASLRLRGWGYVFCSLEPLRPWIVLRWQEKDWYVDEEGTVWQADLPENAQVEGVARPPGPPLVWEEQTISPLVKIVDGQRIFHSRLPMGKLTGWVEELHDIGWLPKIEAWSVRHRENGQDVVLRMSIGGRKARVILDGERIERWKGLAKVVERIVADFGPEGAYLIDTTYEDKIVVRKDYQ